MSEANELVQETELQEEKFFGVKTEINTNPIDEVEIEVINDTPEEDRRSPKVETSEPVDDETVDKEISDYSKRAGDRISKIKYEYHEERRAKEQALRESQEAVKVLQNLMSENNKLKSVVDQGGNILNQQALNNAQWAKYNAQQTFKKAYEEGDADAMSASQAELAQATLAEQQAGTYAQTMQQNIASQYVEPVQPQQQRQVVKQNDPDMDNWSQKNPWFMGSEPIHKEMTSYAMYVDESLKASGIDPAKESEKYYSEVDSKMKQQFPTFFGVQETNSVQTEPVQITSNKRQVSNPVAPATRNSNKNPRKIHLTQSQVSIARRLNITPEQYANQLLKES
tara:strand:- start:996 stop:2012 length:1017 start_codon:yes stop_codon:yes gene_type:complete